MMNNRLKNNCKKLLHAFVLEECAKNKDVPDVITDYILDGYLHHLETGSSINFREKNSDLTDFIDRFESYVEKRIVTAQENRVPVFPVTDTSVDVTQLMQAEYPVRNEVVLANLQDTLQRVFEQRLKLHNKFEDVVVSECLGMDVWQMKIDLLLSKCLDSFFRETPGVVNALNKLKSLLEEEAKKLDEELENLEKKEENYKKLEKDAEFIKLVGRYKKLIERREYWKVVCDQDNLFEQQQGTG